jgi:hypothetical protein
MPLNWSIWIPVIVALLGAAFGAYFALYRSQKERLWQDRYETLTSIIESLEIIKQKTEHDYADQVNISITTTKEKERLAEEWAPAKRNLESKTVKLRMLFKHDEISGFLDANTEMARALFAVYETDFPEYADELSKLQNAAEAAIEEAIKVARKKCL